jgi:hypothetical protein
MGGSVDADCPVCALAESLQVERDPVIQKIGQSLAIWPRYLTYVLVLQWIDKKGEIEDAKARDIYTPQSFEIPRTAFTELERLIKKSLVTAPGLGLVDPVLGNDVEIRVDMRNNWRLDMLAQQPLRSDLDEEALVAWTDKLCREIKLEDTTPASYDQLEEYAKHVEKQLTDAPAPTRRGRFDEGQDQTPVPARIREPAAPPRPAPRTLPARPPVSQVEQELDAVPGSDEPAPPPRRAPLPAPVRPAVAPAAPRAMTPPPARRVATPPPEATDDDEVAPETRDAAPPIEDGAETPPPVPASAPRPAVPRRPLSPVSAALRSTLNRGI